MFTQAEREQEKLDQSIDKLNKGRAKYTTEQGNFKSLSQYFADKLSELTVLAKEHRHNLKRFAAADAMQMEYSDYGESELEDLVLSIKKWLMKQRSEMKFPNDDVSSVRSGSSNISNFSATSTSYFLNKGIELFGSLKTPKSTSQILDEVAPGPATATALGTDATTGPVSPAATNAATDAAAGPVSPTGTKVANDARDDSDINDSAVGLVPPAANLDTDFGNDVSRLASATSSDSDFSFMQKSIDYSQQSIPSRPESLSGSLEYYSDSDSGLDGIDCCE